MNLNRRTLLGSLGLLGGAYFLPSLRTSRAQEVVIPKRLVVYHSYHGTMPQFYTPTGLGGGQATETSFQLGEIHQPLAAFKEKMLVMSGLDMPNLRTTFAPSEACGHWYGCVQSLTGDGQQEVKTLAKRASIDHHIFEGMRSANGGVSPTRLPGLYLSIADYNYTHQSPFFTGAGVGRPVDALPQTIYNDRLFPDGTVNLDDVAKAKALAQRRMVLDHVKAEYAQASSRVGALERQRLEQHAALISDLHTSIGLSSRVCVPPELPSDEENYAVRSDAMFGLVQTALACDMTRIVGIVDQGINEADVGFTPGMFGQPDMHQLIHGVDRGGSLDSNPEAIEVVKNWHKAYSTNFAKLLTALDSVTEPDGTTLLDNTLVLWSGEISEGGHGTANMHWLIAGGAGGNIRTNRYLAFGDPMRDEWEGDDAAPTTTDLLCSVASALDVPTTSFGAPEACKGPIEAVFA